MKSVVLSFVKCFKDVVENENKKERNSFIRINNKTI